ncbi:Ketopantoate reductase PanE/ApbA domain containing protein [Rhypophila decipiens]
MAVVRFYYRQPCHHSFPGLRLPTFASVSSLAQTRTRTRCPDIPMPPSQVPPLRRAFSTGSQTRMLPKQRPCLPSYVSIVNLSNTLTKTSHRNLSMGSLAESPKANVLIVGSGGVGTMAAYALEKGGKAQVTAVLRSNYAAVEKNGFQINSLDHGNIQGWRPSEIMNSIPDVSKQHNIRPYDYVVVTTKNIADVSPGVSEIIAPAISPGHTTIALVQNGLNIERRVIEAFPSNPVISGVSFIGATEGPKGTIKHDDHDVLIVGAFKNPNISPDVSEASAKRFVELYGSCAGIDCMYEPDVKFTRWRKLLYNSSYNTVATILQMDTSRMRVSEHIIDDLIRPIMMEIRAAAAAAGVNLPLELIDKMIFADTFEAFFKPSMLQDIERGNYIEFENIVGEPLREAERLGVPTPTLRVVYGMLKGIQWKVREANGLVKVPTSPEGLKYGGTNIKRNVT